MLPCNLRSFSLKRLQQSPSKHWGLKRYCISNLLHHLGNAEDFICLSFRTLVNSQGTEYQQKSSYNLELPGWGWQAGDPLLVPQGLDLAIILTKPLCHLPRDGSSICHGAGCRGSRDSQDWGRGLVSPLTSTPEVIPGGAEEEH